MVGNAEVIQDILQDAHERFLRHSGADKRAPGAWLRTVIVRLAVTYLRNRRRHAEVVLPQEAPELATASIVVESEVERLEWDEQFSAALRTLSADQLSLIELHYWQGMKVGEIAVRWGKSVEAVQQRLTRALRRLRAAMLPHGTNPASLE
jgi:RNA polymerase sigma-70 factor (ECF subfamily)